MTCGFTYFDQLILTWMKACVVGTEMTDQLVPMPRLKVINMPKIILFAWVEALRPSQNFSVVGTFFWVEPVLSNEDEVFCSRTQHRAPGEIRTHDLAIKSGTLPTEHKVLPPNIILCWFS